MLRLVPNTGRERPTATQARERMLSDLARQGFTFRGGRLSVAATNVRLAAFSIAKEKR